MQMTACEKKQVEAHRENIGELFFYSGSAGRVLPRTAVIPASGHFILMEKLVEQTEIAKRLGISNNAFHRIAYYSKLEYKLINNKRHYDFEKVIKIIKDNRNVC